jgi:hypothetical protein
MYNIAQRVSIPIQVSVNEAFLNLEQSPYQYFMPYFLGMHRILFLPDIRPAGYPANPKAGYRISGRISG